ncbi:hypothetical protein TSOC_014455 [Tetrabaena socialis]|uniref:Uncharacterized protein n=1 Tax=Tetrabaena socialis TaxID=47790 RepID=A0A2J7ZHL7_9CHLO|nr:hypothetical protein TSOC_014455 [Tetrabaena socialis]|eukprot:PNG99760.1 hypothetical protein TSOC_014455 [Tetrabaena socialis]
MEVQVNHTNTQNTNDLIAAQARQQLEGTESAVTAGGTPAVPELSVDAYKEVLELLSKGIKAGAQLAAALKRLPAGATTLVRAFKKTSACVFGSPQSFASLRSRMLSVWYLYGPFNAYLTLNPSELSAHIVFRMAGRNYSLDLNGMPSSDRVKSAERYRTVCSNPVLCARFFNLFLLRCVFGLAARSFFNHSFCAVFLGWPPGATEQQDPACFFGQVLAWYFKCECTG